MKEININGKIFNGYAIETTNVSLLVIRANNGAILACGYVSQDVANKFNDVLATVTGVKTFDDMLEKEVCAVSNAAEKLGAKVGMTGKEFLLMISE